MTRVIKARTNSTVAVTRIRHHREHYVEIMPIRVMTNCSLMFYMATLGCVPKHFYLRCQVR